MVSQHLDGIENPAQCPCCYVDYRVESLTGQGFDGAWLVTVQHEETGTLGHGP
jgi:hypothetical protein